MPAVKSKKSTNSKNSKKISANELAEQSQSSIRVRDCLVWPDKDAKNKSAAETGKTDVVYVSLKAQRENMENQESGSPKHNEPAAPPPMPPRDDGTAIDALRGWPRHRQQTQQEDTYQAGENDIRNDVTGPPAENRKQSTQKAKTTGNGGKAGQKSNKRSVATEPNDTTMGDIMSTADSGSCWSRRHNVAEIRQRIPRSAERRAGKRTQKEGSSRKV